MNQEEIIKYINTHFKNIIDDKIKPFEQSAIKNSNFEKTYKLKNLIIDKHFIINAIEEFNNKLTLENKEFRVDFDEDTHEYFFEIDFNFFKKYGCKSNDEQINSFKMYQAKLELNKLIKENYDYEKSRMISFVKDKYFGYPLFEITVK